MIWRSGGSGLFRLEAVTPGSAPVPRRPSTAYGRRGAGVWAFLLALLTAGALAHVGVRLKNLEIAYELGRERRVTTQLEERKRQLQIEIGMLKDPGRVISLARDKLKMGAPAPEAIRRLDSLKPAAVPTTTTPAAATVPGARR